MFSSRLLFFAALGMSAAVAVFYPEGVGFTVLYALLILFLLSLATAVAARFSIKINERVGQDALFKNESLSYSVEILNKSVFFYTCAQFDYHNEDVISYSEYDPFEFIGPKSSGTSDCEVSFPFRGVYKVGIKRAQVMDFLGLFRVTIPINKSYSVTVYPESDESFALSIRSEPQNSVLNSDQFNEDYTSVSDVRKYTGSESFRKIHWKLSARRGELLVKNFQIFEPDKIILFLDTKSLPLTGTKRAAFEDKMVSCAASAVNQCLMGKMPSELVFGPGEADRLPVYLTDDMDGIFKTLAEIRFGSGESAITSALRIPGSYNMVIFLADIDQTAHDAVKDLISFDHNVVLCYFYSADLPLLEQEDYLLESLAAYGAGLNKIEV